MYMYANCIQNELLCLTNWYGRVAEGVKVPPDALQDLWQSAAGLLAGEERALKLEGGGVE